MSKILKALFVATAVFVFFAALTGCNGNSQSAKDQESTPTPAQQVNDLGKIKVYFIDWAAGKFNSQMEEHNKIKEAVSKKLLEDRGVKIDIQAEALDSGTYTDKMNVLLASGEEFDAWYLNNAQLATTITKPGAAMPLDDLLKSKAPNLLKIYNNYELTAVSAEGKIYAIPRLDSPTLTNLVIRADLLEKAGLDMPKTMNELEAAFAKFKEMGYIPLAGQFFDIERIFSSEFGLPIVPYSAGIGAIYDEAAGKVVNIYSMDKYYEMVGTFKKWYKNGWLFSDYLLLNQNKLADLVKANKVACWTQNGAWITDTDLIPAFKALNIDAKIKPVPLLDSGKRSAVSSVTGGLLIRANSKNAQAVVEYMDWLASDVKNIALACYGIEGEHASYDWANNTFTHIGKYAPTENGFAPGFLTFNYAPANIKYEFYNGSESETARKLQVSINSIPVEKQIINPALYYVPQFSVEQKTMLADTWKAIKAKYDETIIKDDKTTDDFKKFIESKKTEIDTIMKVFEETIKK